MLTTAVRQREATAIADRTDQLDMDKMMVVRIRGQRLSERSESCAIRLHRRIPESNDFAQQLVRVGKMMMWLVLIKEVVPPALFPGVGALEPDRCMSEWGDGANASLGYTVNARYPWERTGNKSFCLRYWITSANVLPCEQYAVHNGFYSTTTLKHLLASQDMRDDAWDNGTVPYPDLWIQFFPKRIQLISYRGNCSLHRCVPLVLYEVGRSRAFWSLLRSDSPPDADSVPTNLCSAQAANTTTLSANALYTTAATLLTAATAGAGTIVGIAIGVIGGIAVLGASGYVVFRAIKQRSRANESDSYPPEIVHLHRELV